MRASSDLELAYETVNCANCGGAETAPRYRIAMANCALRSVWIGEEEHPIQADQTLVACRRCGLVYVNPRLRSIPDLMPYSPALERQHFDETRAQRRRVFQEIIDQMPRWLGRPGRTVLDIGCGDGELLNVAAEAGYACTGFEVSEEMIALIRASGAKHQLLRRLEDASPAAYDLVVLISVLEHVHDPGGLLDAVRRVLRRDGRLVIKVPNIGSQRARREGARWHQIEPLGHLYYFDPATLADLLGRHGLVIQEHFPYHVGPLLQRLSAGLPALAQIAIRIANHLWDDDIGVVVRHA